MKNGINFISLGALTVMGDAFLCLAFSGNLANDIISFVLASVITIALALTLKFALAHSHKIKTAFYVTAQMFGILVLVTTAAFTLKNFADYAAKTMLQAKDIFLPFVALAVLALYLAKGSKKVILKLATVALPVMLLIIAFIFTFSVQFMSVKYFIPHKMPNAQIKTSLFPLLLSLAPSVLPIILFGKGEKSKNIFFSLAIGLSAVAVCFFNVLGIFGSEFASTLSYPYSVSVSTSSMGEIFSRLDGFFYAALFFTTLTKVGICVYCTKDVLSDIICKISNKNFNFTIEKRKSLW